MKELIENTKHFYLTLLFLSFKNNVTKLPIRSTHLIVLLFYIVLPTISSGIGTISPRSAVFRSGFGKILVIWGIHKENNYRSGEFVQPWQKYQIVRGYDWGKRLHITFRKVPREQWFCLTRTSQLQTEFHIG